MPQLPVNGPKCVAEQTRFVLYSFNTFYRKILESKVSTSARYPGFNKEFGIEVIFVFDTYPTNSALINHFTYKMWVRRAYRSVYKSMS